MSALSTSVLAVATTTQTPIGQDPQLTDFGRDPFWLILLKTVFVFVYLLVTTLMVIWFERRVIGRMQQRPGPNRTGPFGLLQTLADGVKLALKEDIVPKGADRVFFWMAPAIAGAMAFVSFAVIPFGPMVSIFGTRTPLQLTDTPVSLLLILAVASVGVYGIVLAGWSSGSTYPLLGGLRSSAQVISYEIAMGLSLVGVMLYAGSMSTAEIVTEQKGLWFIVPAIFSFAVYVVTMVGETNRLPFDLAEGEGELTGGFHTEYSSLKFAMFFLGEYVNMATVSALATTIFLGGWRAPYPLSAVNDGMFNEGWWPMLWFTVKLWGFLFFFVWLRGSLPRVRYDQFMKLGWKLLIPASLLWIVAIATIKGTQQFTDASRQDMLTVIGAIAVVLVGLAWVYDVRRERRMAEQEAGGWELGEVDPFAGGFPVPPLPGQTVRRSRGALERRDADAAADADRTDDRPTDEGERALGSTTQEATRG